MLSMKDIKPLTPLEYGSILIVGGKASNFDETLRTHPRIIMWDSTHEHWTNKNIPNNVKAIFITRFIGHAAFKNIIEEARKKRITIFNPEGTGMIVRQVRELLDINRTRTMTKTVEQETPTVKTVEATVTPTTPMNTIDVSQFKTSKLKPLIPFIDMTKNNATNARALLIKAKEMNIPTTLLSLGQFIGNVRNGGRGKTGHVGRKKTVAAAPTVAPTIYAPAPTSTKDVSVEMLDNVIKELRDMRDYIVAVTKENENLKLRIEKFKKVLSND